MKLKIKKSDYNLIVNTAVENYPFESCGILAGKNNIVEKVYKMKNVSDKPEICYFMDPKEQINVMKEIRISDMELLAIYHSHINVKAYPSKRDIELAFYPDAFYIIVSVFDKKFQEMNIFKIINGEILDAAFEILE